TANRQPGEQTTDPVTGHRKHRPGDGCPVASAWKKSPRDDSATPTRSRGSARLDSRAQVDSGGLGSWQRSREGARLQSVCREVVRSRPGDRVSTLVQLGTVGPGGVEPPSDGL